MKNIVAKCTQSVTYRRKLYRPIRTSSQVAHRPLNYTGRGLSTSPGRAGF